MSTLEIKLFTLYLPLVAWVSLGVALGKKLPQKVLEGIGKFLFWVGVPISIFTFLRQADLSGAIWIAPVTAWVAMLSGAFLSWVWLNLPRSPDFHEPTPGLHQRLIALHQESWNKASQGSFFLSTMFGNTGYLGYPVTLALVGPEYFAWALFYDTLGSTLGAYGLGVAIAARFGKGHQTAGALLRAIVVNPGLWSFGIGLICRPIPLPESIEQLLRICAWSIVALSLLLIGMRLSQISSWNNLYRAFISFSIKMLIVPLAIGIGLTHAGIGGFPHLVIVLQSAMPPAFATLILTEAYDLDRELTVTTLALGSVSLLITLPIWLWLFPP